MKHRRDFLRTSALGLAAASVPASLRAAAPAPAAAPAIVSSSTAIPRGAIADWHTHWIGPRVVKLLSERRAAPRYVINAQGEKFAVGKGETAPLPGAKPQASIWFNIEERLAHLDAVGVQSQLIGWTGASYDGALAPDEARPLWRAQNDDLGDLVRQHPKRFLGLATLPTADIPAAAAELERAHRELGLIGATLPLDAFIHLESARALAPIFSVAQKYKSHIYIHRGPAAPTVPRQTPEVGETNAYFGLAASANPNGAVAGVPGDHTWARSTLITSAHLAAGAITLALTDFLDPYPDVTVQHTMIGGAIAHLIEAVEQRTERDGQPSPIPKLRRIYLDTGATGRGPRGIALAAKVLGADRILFGSDYGPWATIEPFVKGVADAELTREERDLIYVENARRLLKSKNLV
jgi:predicted TIM-barrel fold metal-dependent hydrolase